MDDNSYAINRSMKPVSKINFTDDSVPMMELDDPTEEDNWMLFPEMKHLKKAKFEYLY